MTHLEAFDAACAEYASAAGVRFEYERDADAGVIRVRLRADGEPPDDLGVIVGDFLHNARSALDAIAWETCQQTGIEPRRPRQIYFPISADRKGWDDNIDRWLPNVSDEHREVFRTLQPWYWHERAAETLGKDVDADRATRHPLYRLNDMAIDDRHRVPYPVLARPGHSWLSSPKGVEVMSLPGDSWPVAPGGVVLEWRIDPPHAVDDVFPDGEPILVLSEDAAFSTRSATGELQGLWGAAELAIRTVEIEVLQVVTPTEMDELADLQRAYTDAQENLEDLHRTPHVIDAYFADRFRTLQTERDDARQRFDQRRGELFG